MSDLRAFLGRYEAYVALRQVVSDSYPMMAPAQALLDALTDLITEDEAEAAAPRADAEGLQAALEELRAEFVVAKSLNGGLRKMWLATVDAALTAAPAARPEPPEPHPFVAAVRLLRATREEPGEPSCTCDPLASHPLPANGLQHDRTCPWWPRYWPSAPRVPEPPR